MRIGSRQPFTGTKVFAALTAVLYVAFLLVDIVNGSTKVSSILKFSSIVLCFLMTIWQSIHLRGNKDNLLMNVAFLCTVTADVFLLFTDQYIYGVIAFCIVQMLYLFRIEKFREYVLRVEGRVIRKHRFHVFTNCCLQLVLRIVVAAGSCLVLYFSQIDVDTLLVVTVFYIINFSGNLMLLPKLIRKRHYFQGNIPIVLFTIGMILFFLCDLSVGAYNLSSYVGISKNAHSVIEALAGVAMWGFYLPGQVLIVFSGEKRYEND